MIEEELNEFSERKGYDWKFKRDLLNYLQISNKSETIGCGLFKKSYSINYAPSSPNFYISSLFLDEPGKGWGTKLMKYIKDYSIEKGLKNIVFTGILDETEDYELKRKDRYEIIKRIGGKLNLECEINEDDCLIHTAYLKIQE